MSSKNVRRFKKAVRKMLKPRKPTSLVPLQAKVSRLSKIIRADRHWYDRVFVGTPINAFPVNFAVLNSIVAGDSNNNRQGTVVKPVFINIKGTIALNPANVISKARMLLVRDWGSPMGTAANPNQILDGTYFGTLNSPNAPRYVNDLKRFQVIYDQTMTLSTASNTSIRHFEISRKLSGQIQFFSNNGTDWDKGTIYFIVMDDNTSGVNDNNISFVSRLTYYP